MADDKTINGTEPAATRDTDPAPAPPEESAPATSYASPETFGWVVGGSTSGKHDKWMQQQQADARSRRSTQDAMFNTAATGQLDQRLQDSEINGTGPGGVSKMLSRKLGGSREHMTVVIDLHRGGRDAVEDWMVCELMVLDGGELMLQMVCPRCIFSRSVPQDQAEMHIRQTNRKFTLDTKHQGTIWVNPKTRDAHVIAGKITMHEWATCARCDMNFIIDDSVLRTR